MSESQLAILVDNNPFLTFLNISHFLFEWSEYTFLFTELEKFLVNIKDINVKLYSIYSIRDGYLKNKKINKDDKNEIMIRNFIDTYSKSNKKKFENVTMKYRQLFKRYYDIKINNIVDENFYNWFHLNGDQIKSLDKDLDDKIDKIYQTMLFRIKSNIYSQFNDNENFKDIVKFLYNDEFEYDSIINYKKDDSTKLINKLSNRLDEFKKYLDQFKIYKEYYNYNKEYYNHIKNIIREEEESVSIKIKFINERKNKFIELLEMFKDTFDKDMFNSIEEYIIAYNKKKQDIKHVIGFDQLSLTIINEFDNGCRKLRKKKNNKDNMQISTYGDNIFSTISSLFNNEDVMKKKMEKRINNFENDLDYHKNITKIIKMRTIKNGDLNTVP